VTKHRLMKQLETAYPTVWSLWDEAEKTLDGAKSPSGSLYEATNLIESAKVALMVAYQKLGGDIRDP